MYWAHSITIVWISHRKVTIQESRLSTFNQPFSSLVCFFQGWDHLQRLDHAFWVLLDVWQPCQLSRRKCRTSWRQRTTSRGRMQRMDAPFSAPRSVSKIMSTCNLSINQNNCPKRHGTMVPITNTPIMRPCEWLWNSDLMCRRFFEV